MRTRDLAIVDNPASSYECFYCGPSTAFDFNPMAADDEPTALKIQENLKSAFANTWPRPFDLGAKAGTVPCPECDGHPKVHRLTPDFAKAFGLQAPWDFNISKRIGAKIFNMQNEAQLLKSRFRKEQFLEYPGAPPVPVEMTEPEKKDKASSGEDEKDESGFKLTHKSAFSLEDYVLNFASDDEGH